MARKTTDNTETRLLAMLLKTADATTLRQCVKSYAAKDAAFGSHALKCLTKKALPKSVTSEAYRAVVRKILKSACKSRPSYSFPLGERDWKKIGRELETLWSVFSLNLEGEEGLCAGYAVMEFFTQASDCDELFEDDVYDIETTVEQGQELLMRLLRAEGTPPEWKRAVLNELELVCQKGEHSQFGYFAMEFFLQKVIPLVLTEEEQARRVPPPPKKIGIMFRDWADTPKRSVSRQLPPEEGLELFDALRQESDKGGL